MTDQPRAPLETAEVTARQLGQLIHQSLPPGWAFVFCLASIGEGGFVTYLTNVAREDAIKLLRETADAIERGVGKR